MPAESCRRGRRPRSGTARAPAGARGPPPDQERPASFLIPLPVIRFRASCRSDLLVGIMARVVAGVLVLTHQVLLCGDTHRPRPRAWFRRPAARGSLVAPRRSRRCGSCGTRSAGPPACPAPASTHPGLLTTGGTAARTFPPTQPHQHDRPLPDDHQIARKADTSGANTESSGVSPTYRNDCRPPTGTASATCRPRTGTNVSTIYRGSHNAGARGCVSFRQHPP